MLPSKYMQAVIAGESVAALIGITFRIITKASLRSDRVGALVFFAISLFLIFMCIICHLYIKGNTMVKFYTKKCAEDESLELLLNKSRKWKEKAARKEWQYISYSISTVQCADG